MVHPSRQSSKYLVHIYIFKFNNKLTDDPHINWIYIKYNYLFRIYENTKIKEKEIAQDIQKKEKKRTTTKK